MEPDAVVGERTPDAEMRVGGKYPFSVEAGGRLGAPWQGDAAPLGQDDEGGDSDGDEPPLSSGAR